MGLSNISIVGSDPFLLDIRKIYALAYRISSSQGTYRAMETAAFKVGVDLDMEISYSAPGKSG